MRNRLLMGAAGVALAAGLGGAQANAQVYIGGEGGWTHLTDSRDRGTVANSATIFNRNERFDDGFNVGARVGYQLGPMRFEGEYSYKRNKLTSFNAGVNAPVARVGGVLVSTPAPAVGTPAGQITGSDQTHAIMANFIYDFQLGLPITPHLGVGVGAADVRIDRASSNLGTLVHDDSWKFAYQGIAGIKYEITPALALDLDYRYFATLDPRVNGNRIANFGSSIRSEYKSHNVVASLTVKFGAPPPPPPPMATQAPMAGGPVSGRRVFLVFFDFDRDTLTPEGLAIVRQAADAYRAGGPVRLQITGYTDRSGSPGYNQRLSERRANAVATALGRLGVARTDMSVSGRGENDNRVPTADGVREPQNRRVEIVFP